MIPAVLEIFHNSQRGASIPNGANDGNTSQTNVLQRTGSKDTSTDELYLLTVMQCVIL